VTDTLVLWYIKNRTLLFGGLKMKRLKQLWLVLLVIGITACITTQPITHELPEITEPEIVPEITPDNVPEIVSKEIDNRSGIVLTFDDYHPVAWARHFDLFDKYDAKVTFFVHEQEVVAGRLNNIFTFCLNAQNRGHEVGYHTINHPELTRLTREQFFEQTISRLDLFKNAGIEFTSFAYPYGTYADWMNEELLKYYKITRGLGGIRLYSRDEMKYGFLISETIDNIRFRDDAAFETHINRLLNMVKDTGKIMILTTHGISSAQYAITPARLEYLLAKGTEYGIKFYTFKDFQ